MTEQTVFISITTEINRKAIKIEMSAEAASLDGEMIKMKVQLIKGSDSRRIRGNVDKLIAKRLKGRGRSWRIPGIRAMVTLCRFKPQWRDLALKLTRHQSEYSSPQRKKTISYDSWLQCSVLFLRADQNSTKIT